MSNIGMRNAFLFTENVGRPLPFDLVNKLIAMLSSHDSQIHFMMIRWVVDDSNNQSVAHVVGSEHSDQALHRRIVHEALQRRNRHACSDARWRSHNCAELGVACKHHIMHMT
jgi:hypothetical protein